MSVQGMCLFVTKDVTSHGGAEQLASSGCFEVCMCGFCVVLVSEGKQPLVCLPFQNLLRRLSSDLHMWRSPPRICPVAAPRHITSSGLWRRLYEQPPCCGLMNDVARQDMALGLEEKSSTVDTIQHVVARQSVTRQTKTLHASKVRSRDLYRNHVIRTVMERMSEMSFFRARQENMLASLVLLSRTRTC